MLELNFLEGGQKGKTVRMNFETAWFGRQPTCDFVLGGEGISRVHFSIVKRGQDYVLIDNKSTNGTYVNRVRTIAVTLKPGYVITAGSNVIQIREVATELAGTPFRFVIEYVAEEASTERSAQVFEQTSILLGRKTICQVHLNELDVSPVHAELSFGPEGLIATDRSTDAGLHINGQRILRQQLKDGDLIQIRPFELTVQLKPEMCVLRIRRISLQTATYRAARDAQGTAPAPQKDSARPSDYISALPAWQREKAPVYIPSSDILPNRARFWVLIGALGLVAAGSALAWASSRSFYVPGPVREKHADIGANCSACHTGFAREQDTSCAACHQDNTARALHVKANLACIACHTEHQGVQFDFAKAVGTTCQAGGCHVTMHEKIKADKEAVTAAFAISFLGAKDKGSFELKSNALAVKTLPSDSPVHKTHQDKGMPCESCHSPEDKSPRNEVLNSKGAVVTAGVASKARRERCLVCHGFGPQATLQVRCIGCHFEHPADAEKTARFVAAAAVTSGGTPIQIAPAGTGSSGGDRQAGLAYMFGLLAGFPLMYAGWTAIGLRLNSGKARFLAAAEALALKPAPPPPPAVERQSDGSKKVGPQAQLRPQIDIDACLACGTCVHACPFNVLEMVDEKAKAVRMDDCTGYAACAAECPPEAITMIDQGPARTQELPHYDTSLETNVPGLYLAGEVTGKALIKVAINQGRTVVNSILRNRPNAVAPMYDLIVVGAGPAGTSTALAAKEAGLRVLVLEQGSTANTVRSFPRQKFVMAEPVMIPLAGPLWMEDTSKESLLEKWQEIIQRTGLIVNEEEKVLEVTRLSDGNFGVRSTKGEYLGARVVVAVGRRGSPRKLGVPGEDSTKVAYSLLDAEAYQGKAICIVGGGDSGIEAANGLSREELKNQVFLVHRGGDFNAAKPRNQKKIKKNLDAGSITAFYNAAVIEIRIDSAIVRTEQGPVQIPNDFVFVMVGGENPKKFLSQCGIEFSHRALV